MRDFRSFSEKLAVAVDFDRPDLFNLYRQYVQSLLTVLGHTKHDHEMSPFVAIGAFLKFHNVSGWRPHHKHLDSFFEAEPWAPNPYNETYEENVRTYNFALSALDSFSESSGSFIDQYLKLPLVSRQKMSSRAYLRVTLLAMLGAEEGFRLRLTQKELDDLYKLEGRIPTYLGAIEASAEELAAMRILITKQAGILVAGEKSDIKCDWEKCSEPSDWSIRCPKHSTTEFICATHFRFLIYSNSAELVNFTRTCKHTLDYRLCHISSLNPEINLKEMGY